MGGDQLCFLDGKKGRSGNLINMVFKREVAAENDSKVQMSEGGRESIVVSGEAEVVNGFGE